MGRGGRRLRGVAVLPGKAWRPWGCGTCWTFRPALRCGRRSPPGPVRSIRDSGVPANPGSETVSAGPWSSAATSCRRRPGVRLRWPREARDHAATFSAPRGCDRPAGASPAKIHWAVYRRNLDGSEPRYYLSNAPENTPLETLAYVGGSRWRIETEFETEKSDVGLDEYETRTWGWLASPRGPVPAGRSFSAEPATGLGGKRCPGSRGRRSTGWCGKCCPGNGSGQLSCCGGWRRRRTVMNGPNAPMPSAAPPCGHHPTSLPELTL